MKLFKKIKVSRYKNIFWGSLFLLAGILFAITFFSFNPQDPSWMYTNSSALVPFNLFGSLGAHVAAFFFYVFGSATFLLVVLCGYLAYLFFFNISFKKEWDRALVLFFLPVVASSFFYFYRFDFFSGVMPGGVVGRSTYALFLRWFDSLGSTVFVHVLFFASLTILFPTFFLKLLQATGHSLRFLASKEKFLRPAWAVSKKVGHAVTIPVLWSVNFIKRLFDGSEVTEADQSIVCFEEQLVHDVEFESAPEDPFWNEYTNRDQSDGVGSQKKVAPVKKDKSLEGQLSIAGMSEQKKDVGAVRLEQEEEKKYQLPHKEIFKEADAEDDKKAMTDLERRAKTLEEKLERFGVYGKVISIKRGPVVTLFEYQPQIDSKISKIIALEDDLALALKALSIRIIAPIPGKSVVGFEVANTQRKDVLLSSIIRSKTFETFHGSLPLVLGKDTTGHEVLVDLAKMPHLLIAGSTGSGKSVALNAFLVSLLCKLTPDQLKLILVDPKRLEFASYADIPHLLFPIVTEPKRTAPVLRWVVQQMEERYQRMSEVGARNIFDYNRSLASNTKRFGDVRPEPLPFIVIVIDELSDLMMTSGRDIEDLIARIAQMARAAGIHMIVATQRPSVDVITGLIKVNFPSRISFRVTSKVDSRTILDYCGAEKLLGSGDMLFLDSKSSLLKRLHGAYVSNQEIDTLANHIRAEQKVEYLDLSPELIENNSELSAADDALYKDVLAFLETVDEVSISLLQRKFRIGYNRSARIIDMLEARGVVLPSEGSKMRKVIR